MSAKLHKQRVRQPRWLLALIFGLISAPAAHASAPSVSAASDVSPDEARLEAVGYKLSTANISRCMSAQMFTGMLVHDITGYRKSERLAVRETFDLTTGFGVLHVVPGSVAERSGIKVGDEIISLNETNLEAFEAKKIPGRANYHRTEKFIELLDEALVRGSAQVVVRRSGSRLSLKLSGQPGCGGRTTYRRRTTTAAWSDGRYVAITQGMIKFAGDDQELAFVVAHEMAHNILDHAERLPKASGLLSQFGIGLGRIKQFEVAADELAIELMFGAGYDATAAERLLLKTSRLIPLDLGLTHPRVARRVQNVRETINRLSAQQILASLR